MTHFSVKIHCHGSHQSCLFFTYQLDDKIQILWLWMPAPKGKSFARALSASWPHAWIGIKIKILSTVGSLCRIHSTEMEMMAAFQNLSNNSTQAELRAVRSICLAPWFPQYLHDPVHESVLSITSSLTLFSAPPFPKPHIQNNTEYEYVIFLFKLSVFPPTSFGLCTLIPFT